MTSIFDGIKWLFDGLKVHDMVAGFFHIAGIWALIKVFSLEKQLDEQEQRLSQLEQKEQIY